MVKSREELEKHITLKEEERKWFEEPSSLPLLISDNLMSLINPEDPEDPVRRQFVPDCRECEHSWTLDPLKEVSHSVTGRLIHRYEHRVALLTTDRCFSYCRHCFRRRFTGTDSGAISKEEIDQAAGYLSQHKEIYEVLLTGGDLFTLSDDRLDYLFSALKNANKNLVLRLCTRAIVSYPQRFDDSLMKLIEKYCHDGPFMLMTQINHPRELTEECIAAVRKFLSIGIPAFNQSVLLKGVNDSADTLEELCIRLLYNRIKPYYLFQCDLVQGTDHLRVDVAKGLEIERELRKRLSGLAMPQYTIDLPQGGGKVILTHQYLEGVCDGFYVFTTPDGEQRLYPQEGRKEN